MTLTAELALAYLRELSADYRSGVVLDAHGDAIAGDARLAIDLSPGTHHGATDAGKVFAIRSPTYAIVVTTGPFALPRVTLRDLRTVLSALGAESAQETAVQRIPHSSVEALLGNAN